ncbi:MAG: SusC/RagA family TonB-linked outer membrane protein [Bacteroidales bacterium]
MKKFLLLTLSVMMGFSALFAQHRVTGKVTSSEDGAPIPYVTVVVVGTTISTQTNLDGSYSINVPTGNNILRFTFMGMQTVNAEINGRAVVDLVMHPDVVALEDVVVVAYGTAKKESLTGSATVLDSQKLSKRVVANVTKALDGMSTGVITTSGSGQPGSDASVIIRGYGSINASQTPLYVVDGIPFNGSLNSINPADIESMTVLKDASSGALYGARGANGVIMITTKRAKGEKVSITYNGSAGISNRALKRYDMVNQTDFVNMTWESLRNSYCFDNGYSWEEAGTLASQGLADALGGELYNPFKNYTWATVIDPATGAVRADAKSAYDENWMDEIEHLNAFRHEHQLTVAGGTAKTKALMSLGFLDEDGILKTTSFQRFTGRANIDSQINDWVKTGLNLSASMTKSNSSDYTGSTYANVWYSAQFMAPIYPVWLKDDAGNDLLDELGNRQLDYGKTRPNLNDFSSVGTLYDDKFLSTGDNVSARTFLAIGSDQDSAGFLKGIKLTANFGVDFVNSNSTTFYNMYHGNAASSNGRLTKSNGRMLSYTFNQLLTWNRSFGNHTFDLLLGHEFYNYSYSYLTAQKTNLVDGILELRPGTTITDADSYSQAYRIESYLSRFNYNFKDKYYFSASFRTDGTSRFYKDSRWGNFWSVGANWRISQESFMRNVTWINNLALKASYGVQGNDDLGTLYAWQSFYSLSYPNSGFTGAIVSSLENKELRWEKNANFNIGLDARLFGGRIDLNFEYFNRLTSDMLLNYPMALSTGFSGYDANVGTMVNKGLELTLSAQLIDTRDFNWRVTFMGSHVKNKIIALTEDAPEIVSGIYLYKEGLPIRTFYMAKSAGVDPANGARLYWVYDEKDDDGNPIDPYISSDYAKASTSKWYHGSRIPDLYGSVSTEFTFFNCVDLSIMGTYSIGGKMYDGLYTGALNPMYTGNTWSANALRRWQKPGDKTDVPRAGINAQYASTDDYLIDASYFAIKNITLGYTLPASAAKKMGVSLLRIYITLDNMTMFNYLNGMDPQYDFSGSTDYVYSPNKTYTIGLNLNF